MKENIKRSKIIKVSRHARKSITKRAEILLQKSNSTAQMDQILQEADIIQHAKRMGNKIVSLEKITKYLDSCISVLDQKKRKAGDMLSNQISEPFKKSKRFPSSHMVVM